MHEEIRRLRGHACAVVGYDGTAKIGSVVYLGYVKYACCGSCTAFPVWNYNIKSEVAYTETKT